MVRREKSNYIIQSVSHALDVLEEFRGDVDELGVTELSKKLKLHKNNVFRILATLQSRNYIEQDKTNENYRLGVRCLELGQTFIQQRGMLKQAKPILQELAEKTGETSYMSILRGNDVMPAHATAAGKALVAFESEEDLRKRFGAELKAYTTKTFRTFEDLYRDIERVREKGFATDLEEFEEGLRCIAAPVRDYTRKVIGALSVSGPAHRLTDDMVQTAINGEVTRLAKELSTRLGFRE
jgi:IclR family KDG regulon transcriptional repressor